MHDIHKPGENADVAEEHQDDILLVKMLTQLEANEENDDYIMKALTCGVKLRNHGNDPVFHAKVDRFAEILESLRQKESIILAPVSPKKVQETPV